MAEDIDNRIYGLLAGVRGTDVALQSDTTVPELSSRRVGRALIKVYKCNTRTVFDETLGSCPADASQLGATGNDGGLAFK